MKRRASSTLKTIAAFLNSRERGTLLIGVADDGSVFGLESDYSTLRKDGKDDRDLFGLHLNQAVINAVGMAAAANVGQEMLEVGGRDLCWVHVRPSSFPVEATVVEVDKKRPARQERGLLRPLRQRHTSASSSTVPPPEGYWYCWVRAAHRQNCVVFRGEYLGRGT